MTTATQGISIFATMSQMCRQYNAINLAQGCPDFAMDDALIRLAHHYMQQGFNQYAPMEGIMKLRENISVKTQLLYQSYYDPATEITLTTGATEGVYCAIAAIVKPGDEVIVLEPAFDSYLPVVRMFGGIPVPVSLDLPNYAVNWFSVRNALSARTKMIIVNSPHNPTGTVLSAEDMQELEDIAVANNLYVLSDEVYEHILFDDISHKSAASFSGLKERTLITTSFGKTFHSTGWRLGACLAPGTLTERFRKIHQFVTFSPATPMQYAVADYLENPAHYLTLPPFYQQKRDTFLDMMRNSRFTCIPSQGTYFQLMSYDEISSKNDMDFSAWLVAEARVACIPLSPFYTHPNKEKVVRFCFAKKNETLASAAEILCRI